MVSIFPLLELIKPWAYTSESLLEDVSNSEGVFYNDYALMYAAERSSKLGLRVFVELFFVAKPKLAVSLTSVSAAVFRHPAGAMESMGAQIPTAPVSISRQQCLKKLDYPSYMFGTALDLCYTTHGSTLSNSPRT
jgi:hypothetical protein